MHRIPNHKIPNHKIPNHIKIIIFSPFCQEIYIVKNLDVYYFLFGIFYDYEFCD